MTSASSRAGSSNVTSPRLHAATSPSAPLAPFSFDRRIPGQLDVALDVLYCGVCHSDLRTARNEWQNTVYPSVPGHEIVGRVTAVATLKAAWHAKMLLN